MRSPIEKMPLISGTVFTTGSAFLLWGTLVAIGSQLVPFFEGAETSAASVSEMADYAKFNWLLGGATFVGLLLGHTLKANIVSGLTKSH